MSGEDNFSSASSLSDLSDRRIPISNPPPEGQTDVSTSIVFGGILPKSDSMSTGETEYSASNEGVEVEAIEFNSPKRLSKDERSSYRHRRLLLLILAFLVILISSAVAGFWILSGKKSSSSSAALSSDGSTNYEEDVEVPQDTESSDNTLNPLSFGAEDEAVGWEDTTDPAEPASSAFVETLSPVAAPTPAPSTKATDEITAEVTSKDSSLGSFGATALWQDRRCPEHDLTVSSSCVPGSTNVISTASFCFASKRDGDWYWVRNSVAEDSDTADYDLWDYTEETEGELTLLDLSTGNYIISLVRDSMRPYDEIISHEFTVPECV